MILEHNWNYSFISYKSSIFYNIVLLFYSRLKKLGDICHNAINFEGLTPERQQGLSVGLIYPSFEFGLLVRARFNFSSPAMSRFGALSTADSSHDRE